jgi:flagellar basal-body rod protein FlgC
MVKTIYDIAANAMSLNRLRINTIASNIANAQTTRTPEGGPYKRRDVLAAATDVQDADFTSHLDEASMKGVTAAAVMTDNSPPMMIYDPGHPDADPKTGMVAMPNISPVTEMVNMVTASNAYKAAAEVISTAKEIGAVLRQLANRI